LTVRIEPTADASLAAIRDLSRFGIAIAAIIKIIATTINNSISENPFCFFVLPLWNTFLPVCIPIVKQVDSRSSNCSTILFYFVITDSRRVTERSSKISPCFVHLARLRVTDSVRIASHKLSLRGMAAAPTQRLPNSLSLLTLSVLAGARAVCDPRLTLVTVERWHSWSIAGNTGYRGLASSGHCEVPLSARHSLTCQFLRLR